MPSELSEGIDSDVPDTVRLERRIAELERRAAEAAEESTARATFLATMSHELREPMNGVLGMARLLRETALDGEQSSYVDAVIGSAEALITIVNDILDLSRIDAGRMDLDAVDFALRPFFLRLATLLEARASRKGIAFRVELADDLVSVAHGDPGRLRQLLVNLAGNAIKFTSQGEVVVGVTQAAHDATGTTLQVAVRDTGPGIPVEVQERLFTPFAQADVGVPRVYGGSGLGLMIAQRLAGAMGGRIAVTSDGISGTRFDVTIRLAAACDDADAAVRRAEIAGASLLVVDAQARSRATIEQLAKLWHMHVRAAGTAKEALAAIEDGVDRGAPFDLLVIDRALADQPGDELGRLVRAMPGMEHACMALLVASGVRGDAARARAAGFDAYLPKPVTASTLLDCLQQLRAGNGEAGLLTVHSIVDHRPPSLAILVADDNPVNSRLAGIMLQRLGHRVETAGDGAEALAKLEAGHFDLVLMDVQMPVMNGLEATRQIRALSDATKAATPIIAITANAMRGDDEPCYAAGMNGYVTKPIDKASLSRAIHDALA